MPLVTDLRIVRSDQPASPGTKWRPMLRIDTVNGDINEVTRIYENWTPDRLVYAEGDSWFDKFTPIPVTGTNLLDEIRTPYMTAVVDVSQVGSEAAEMVRPPQSRQTKAMFDLFDFDAILLSAGGNDLKNVFARYFYNRSLPGEMQPEDLTDISDPQTYHKQFQKVISDIRAFIGLRDRARSTKTNNAPIFVHGYDYFQPRPAGARYFALSRIGGGPWLYPYMKDAGLDPAAMRSAADAAIDELNSQLIEEIGQRFENVFVIDQRGLLKPAPADSTDAYGDWLDEIHPSRQGFVTLARNRWDVPLARALGWTPSDADLKPPADKVNLTTARPTVVEIIGTVAAPETPE